LKHHHQHHPEMHKNVHKNAQTTKLREAMKEEEEDMVKSFHVVVYVVSFLLLTAWSWVLLHHQQHPLETVAGN
jgi:hypothetical protein